MIKITKYIFYTIIYLLISAPIVSHAQLDNSLTVPPTQTDNSGYGQGGGPFDNTTNANGGAQVTNPGGPIDPPSDVNDVPIDNGVLFLLIFAIAHGYKMFKRKKDYQFSKIKIYQQKNSNNYYKL